MKRRDFLLSSTCFAVGTQAWLAAASAAKEDTTDTRITSLSISKDGVRIAAANDAAGVFPLKSGTTYWPAIERQAQALFAGRDAFDPALDGAAIWEALHPGQAERYANGIDPLTGADIAEKPRGARHTRTGEFFIACSAVDLALWDLRAKLRGVPAYRLLGDGNRMRLPVYWRPGEPKDLDDARRRGREAFDMGYHAQKWYFLHGPEDGKEGLRANVDLVRVLREELGPDAKLMFDNHNMRYGNDAAYAVSLAKELLPYAIYWLEEPVGPECVEGYARIKGETGIPLAGGEHLYTRWPVTAFLERKCLDFVQSDPVWCGGFSEWLKICGLARAHSGVQVVPHITSPWVAAPHAVASQPAALCPLCEYNSEGGRKTLEPRMSLNEDGEMRMAMPATPGL